MLLQRMIIIVVVIMIQLVVLAKVMVNIMMLVEMVMVNIMMLVEMVMIIYVIMMVKDVRYKSCNFKSVVRLFDWMSEKEQTQYILGRYVQKTVATITDDHIYILWDKMSEHKNNTGTREALP